MTVIAVSKIQHGKEDGTIVEFNIGDTVSGLSDEQLASLVESGGAVETGKTRKFSAHPTVSVEDADTVKRDEIIAKSAMVEPTPESQPTPTGVEDSSATAPSKP